MSDERDDWPEIAATLRIEEVLDELGIEATTIRGDEWFSHCPLPEHGGVDSNPSFSINTDRLVWSCFTCGYGGTPIKLVMRVLDCDYDFAVEWLAKFSDFTPGTDAGFLEQVHRRLAVEDTPWRTKDETVLPWYPKSKVDEWCNNLMSSEHLFCDGELHLDGRNRFIGRDVCRHLKLGYDPEHQRGSHVGPALIIPVFVDDQCVGWQERWLGDDVPSWVPKYTNTTDFPRESTVYNSAVLVLDRPTLVVESPMSVARLLTAGLPAVATYGAMVSPGQLKLLRKMRELWLSYDNDKAGHKAVKTITDALEHHTALWVVPPPRHAEKADLGDCDDDQLEAALRRVTPSIMYSAAHP